MLSFLFGCGHHAIVTVPGREYINVGIVRCVRRVWHDGQHQYPNGWIEAVE